MGNQDYSAVTKEKGLLAQKFSYSNQCCHPSSPSKSLLKAADSQVAV